MIVMDACKMCIGMAAAHSAADSKAIRLANILAAQFYDAAAKAHPEIPDEIAQGAFDTLLGWLRAHLYRHGRKFAPAALVPLATGAPMSIAPYIAYLRKKYGEIYRLPDAGLEAQPPIGAPARL